MSLVFFITGVSSGFGLELALEAISHNHKVIGTVRDRHRAASQVSSIEKLGGKVLELDVTNATACPLIFYEAEKIHGHIDVLINNAGVSHIGALEDITDENIHDQMNTNVYGPFRLIKASLPSFRRRRTGTIVNITSIAGVDGLPSCALYAASKFALEGMSESLARELEGYNVDVLIVEPGAFRTNFLGAYKANSKAHLDDYPTVKDAVKHFDDWNGTQPGDPVKAAERIIEVVSGNGEGGKLKGKILRLPLGPDCVARYEVKIRNLSKDLEAVREVAMSTNVD